MAMPSRRDLALAAALVVAAQLEVWLGHREQRPLLALVCLGLSVPLAYRRIRPLDVLLVVSAVFAAGQVALGEVTELATGTLPFLVATYTAAAYEPVRRARVGAAVALGAAGVSVLAQRDGSRLGNVAYAAIVVGSAWFVGRLIAQRHERERTLSALNAELARDRELLAEAAVASERARIARELHDVVAHAVSVMVVQAGAAAEVLEAKPELARGALESIQQSGRQALVELRHMVALLRADADEQALAPQPGAASVEDLVEQMRQAGLDVELDLGAAGAAALPAGLSLSVYRIAQEALTNALKHAPGSRVRVALRRHGGELELVVANTAGAIPAGPKAPLDGGGHGLVGMRERVALYSGRLDLEPGADGGFTVSARIPLAGAV